MNKQRRETLRSALNNLYMILSDLEEQQTEVESMAEEEADYRDNFPENLMNSERYERAEATADSLEEAVGYLKDAYDYITDATTSIEEAIE